MEKYTVRVFSNIIDKVSYYPDLNINDKDTLLNDLDKLNKMNSNWPIQAYEVLTNNTVSYRREFTRGYRESS